MRDDCTKPAGVLGRVGRGRNDGLRRHAVEGVVGPFCCDDCARSPEVRGRRNGERVGRNDVRYEADKVGARKCLAGPEAHAEAPQPRAADDDMRRRLPDGHRAQQQRRVLHRGVLLQESKLLLHRHLQVEPQFFEAVLEAVGVRVLRRDRPRRRPRPRPRRRAHRRRLGVGRRLRVGHCGLVVERGPCRQCRVGNGRSGRGAVVRRGLARRLGRRWRERVGEGRHRCALCAVRAARGAVLRRGAKKLCVVEFDFATDEADVGGAEVCKRLRQERSRRQRREAGGAVAREPRRVLRVALLGRLPTLKALEEVGL
mmetsp:Transcript_1034/g.3254  ORF Transcript_1034/g.3254 Transcript_1034/m.3254 type:complete len:313 (+) Transcript_1034:1435-2373(+)